MNARTRRFVLLLCVASLTAVPVILTGCGGGSTGSSPATPISAIMGRIFLSRPCEWSRA